MKLKKNQVWIIVVLIGIVIISMNTQKKEAAYNANLDTLKAGYCSANPNADIYYCSISGSSWYCVDTSSSSCQSWVTANWGTTEWNDNCQWNSMCPAATTYACTSPNGNLNQYSCQNAWGSVNYILKCVSSGWEMYYENDLSVNCPTAGVVTNDVTTIGGVGGGTTDISCPFTPIRTGYNLLSCEPLSNGICSSGGKYSCSSGSLYSVTWSDNRIDYYCNVNGQYSGASFQACANGCANGDCINQECMPNTQWCETSKLAYQCSSNGIISPKQTCSDSQTCVEQSSTMASCTSNTVYYCTGNNQLSCTTWSGTGTPPTGCYPDLPSCQNQYKYCFSSTNNNCQTRIGSCLSGETTYSNMSECSSHIVNKVCCGLSLFGSDLILAKTFDGGTCSGLYGNVLRAGPCLCTDLGNTVFNQVSSECICGGTIVTNGYCCNGVSQSGACGGNTCVYSAWSNSTNSCGTRTVVSGTGCTATTKSCVIATDKCNNECLGILQECKSGKCQTATFIWIAGIAFLAIFALKKVNKK